MPTNNFPTSKQEALDRGEKYYFTGEPCHRGHISKRYKNGTCQECRRIDLAKWQSVDSNWMKFLAYMRERKRSLTPEQKELATRKHKEWYAKVKDERNAVRRSADKIARRQKDKERYQKNRDVIRKKSSDRRALQKSVGGKHTIQDIYDQIKKQNGRCYWCCVLLDESYQVDHVIPLTRGGSNGKENIVASCRLCNIRKHASPAIDYVLKMFNGRTCQHQTQI